MRVYSADQQPIRLLAELEGLPPAELIHRAVGEYFAKRRDILVRVLTDAQRAFETADFEGLASALSSADRVRQARREERLRMLGRPPAE